MNANTLTPELLHKMDAYWRAANYLSVGQIYLYDNPLLKQPLKLAHIKPRLLGHRVTAGRGSWPTLTWRARIAKCTQISRKTRTG